MIKNISSKHVIPLSVVSVVVVALVTVMSAFLPQAVDWHGAFRPAALEILHGRSPYNAEGFFNPPWAAILLIPFAILPEHIGRAAMALASLAAYVYVAHRLDAKKVAILFLLLSPPVLHGILNGNIDWLAALGFVLPPWLGLFFLAIKPQVGMATMVFLLFSTWRNGGIKKIITTFTPFGIASLIAIALFGPWFLNIKNDINLAGNASLWPMSIPVGLALLVLTVRKNDIRFSMAASPALSPYVILHSWVGALLAITSSTPETIASVIGLWIVVIYKLIA